MCSCPLWDEDHIWLEQDRDFDEDEEDEDEDEDDEYYDSDSDYYWANIFPSPPPPSFFISYFIRDHERKHEKWMSKTENLKETGLGYIVKSIHVDYLT